MTAESKAARATMKAGMFPRLFHLFGCDVIRTTGAGKARGHREPVMAGLGPAIHVFSSLRRCKTWMPATSAGMTVWGQNGGPHASDKIDGAPDEAVAWGSDIAAQML